MTEAIEVLYWAGAIAVTCSGIKDLYYFSRSKQLFNKYSKVIKLYNVYTTYQGKCWVCNKKARYDFFTASTSSSSSLTFTNIYSMCNNQKCIDFMMLKLV